MKYFIHLILLILMTGQINAQTSVKTKMKKADELYQKDGYMAAAKLYAQMQEQDKSNPELLSKLANSYRLNGNSSEAEFYYSKYLNTASKKEDQLNYAHTLLSNGKCKDAVKWYQNYINAGGEKENVHFITSCDDLNGFPIDGNVKVFNAEGLNSPYLDFSPSFYQNGLLFSSGRPISKTLKRKDLWSQKDFAGMYYSESQGNGKFKHTRNMKWDLNKKYHVGVVSFTPDKKHMYYSANNQNGKSQKKIRDLKIYIAKLEYNKWVNDGAFTHNSDQYKTCHPALSPDGKSIVFSSNMPNGFGGMDLYVSKNEGGAWGKPINLGSEINTSGNEIFPFIDASTILYFSSDGLMGIGGLDIFYALQNLDLNNWINPVNIGIPFNSNKDDLGFIVTSAGVDGYFSSNRPGGMGEDDIYYWTNLPDQNGYAKEGLVTLIIKDKITLTPLPDAVVKLIDSEDKSSGFLTDETGRIGKTFKPEAIRMVQAEKKGYQPNQLYITNNMAGDPEKSILYLEPLTTQSLTGRIMDATDNKPIAGADIYFTNGTNGQIVKATSDSDGIYEFPLECNNEYNVVAGKTDYIQTSLIIPSSEIPCTNSKSIVKDFYLNTAVKANIRKDMRKKYLGDENENFNIGRSFEVKDVLYDYNKFNIRKDADKSLADLVKLLQEYPNMEIELSSHTDSRGKASYNQWLSQKRAESAVQYIISNGISANRLRAAGYGEAALRNFCSDGMKCTEEQHQENRRTEIKILKL